MKKIAKRIKELMDTEKLSNTEFAKRVDVNPAIISHILSGRNNPSLKLIESIKSKFTNVNLDYLINGEGGLFQDFTNVIKEVPSAESPPMQASAFPMEGVRIASVPGSIDLQKSAPEDEEERPEPPPSSSPEEETPGKTDEGIERIVIFYRDGSFRAYRP